MRGERGFTLLELVIALGVLGLISASIWGVVVLGANSAGAGERITEQARRLRIATDLMVRQLRSTEPMRLELDEGPDPFFRGEETQVEFVTSTPQLPGTSSLAVVRYWFDEDSGTVRMAEVPLFATLGEEEIPFDDEYLALETTLLFNVGEFAFSYTRDSDDEPDWEDEWDAADEDELPAAVRVEVRPSTVDGPEWYHEIPIMVGVFNEIADASDFRPARRVRGEARRRPSQDDDDDDDDIDEEIDDDFEDDDFDED